MGLMTDMGFHRDALMEIDDMWDNFAEKLCDFNATAQRLGLDDEDDDFKYLRKLEDDITDVLDSAIYSEGGIYISDLWSMIPEKIVAAVEDAFAYCYLVKTLNLDLDVGEEGVGGGGSYWMTLNDSEEFGEALETAVAERATQVIAEVMEIDDAGLYDRVVAAIGDGEWDKYDFIECIGDGVVAGSVEEWANEYKAEERETEAKDKDDMER